MVARRVVPILLIVGAVLMIKRHSRHGFAGHLEDGEKRGPIGPHGEWGKRVPPLFEMWDKRAHEQEAQQPAAL
jgi:hypothetical protein